MMDHYPATKPKTKTDMSEPEDSNTATPAKGSGSHPSDCSEVFMSNKTERQWTSEMPYREGLYLLKCDESKGCEMEASVYEEGDDLVVSCWPFAHPMPVILLHTDLTNPQWAHLISVSQNAGASLAEPETH